MRKKYLLPLQEATAPADWPEALLDAPRYTVVVAEPWKESAYVPQSVQARKKRDTNKGSPICGRSEDLLPLLMMKRLDLPAVHSLPHSDLCHIFICFGLTISVFAAVSLQYLSFW